MHRLKETGCVSGWRVWQCWLEGSTQAGSALWSSHWTGTEVLEKGFGVVFPVAGQEDGHGELEHSSKGSSWRCGQIGTEGRCDWLAALMDTKELGLLLWEMGTLMALGRWVPWCDVFTFYRDHPSYSVNSLEAGEEEVQEEFSDQLGH